MKQYLLIIISILLNHEIAAQGFWAKISEMPLPVAGGQVIYNQSTTNPKFYILGGYSDFFQDQVDLIQEFDLIKNEWKFAGSMKTSRSNFFAGVYDTSVVYYGGTKLSSSQSNVLEAWDSKNNPAPFVYDTKENFNRKYSTGHIVNDKLIIIGGEGPPSKSLPFLVEYEIDSKSETYQLNLPVQESLSEHISLKIGDNIYITGGVLNGVRNWIKSYNTVSKQLIDRSEQLLAPRAGGAGIYNSKLKKALVIGGFNETKNALNTVEEIVTYFTGAVGVFKSADLLFARKNPMVANYENAILVFGGYGDNGKVVKEVEMYVDPHSDLNEVNKIPTDFSLMQNYPNPFNPGTVISFQLPVTGVVSLKVYDVIGREIKTLKEGELNPGLHSVYWDGRDRNGNNCANGIYFYTLKTEKYSAAKKMILMK